jgi:CheY-like chemotaxis protein
LPEARFSSRANKFIYRAGRRLCERPTRTSSWLDIIPSNRARPNWHSRNIPKRCVSSDFTARNNAVRAALSSVIPQWWGRAVVQASGDRLPRHGLFQATILLVEDEVLVRMSLAEQLRNAGYVVLEASNADEALDLLQGHRVGVVLSDIRMPGRLDGVELAHAIRMRHPEIKIVLASAQSFSASHWSNYDGFFPKPYDARRLIEHVKMLLG